MIYSVWWRRADGALCERSLALDPLTQFLATLATADAPASVVDERGRVVGAVYAPREVLSGAPSEAGRSQWYLELGVTACSSPNL